MSIVAVRPTGDAPPSTRSGAESAQVTDILCQAKHAAQSIAKLEQQLENLRRIRAQAVVKLNNAHVPRSRIAQVVGLSKQRVSQLISAIHSGVAS